MIKVVYVKNGILSTLLLLALCILMALLAQTSSQTDIKDRLRDLEQ